MLNMADFNAVYTDKPTNVEQIPCQPPTCFVGSYAPVTPAGQQGPFNVNSYLLQPDRKFEIAGSVKVTSGDLEKCRK
jgi:hypothetical protein